MKAIMVSVNELRSERFQRLCESLGVDGGDRYRVAGHLLAWTGAWGADPELDSGILFDVTTSRMGEWSAWPDHLKFGRALVKSGFAQPLEGFYPPELLLDDKNRARCGFVTMGFDGRPSLNTTWNMVQRVSCAKARKWCWFLDDADLRWRYCASQGLEVGRLAIEGRIPQEWLEDFAAWCDTHGFATHQADGVHAHEGSRSTLEHTLERTLESPIRNVNSRNRNLEDEDIYHRNVTSAESLRVIRGGDSRGFAPPQHVGKERQSRQGKERQRSTGRDGTGNPKSAHLRDIVSDLKNRGDLLGALRALDGKPAALPTWQVCSDQHPKSVYQVLSELFDEWDNVRNPAAWVMARLRKLCGDNDSYTRRERGTGLGRGEAPTRAAACGGA